jgi:hypothetical protein
MPEYQQQAGGMWTRKDRNGRVYYFISAQAEGKEYRYHAFVNPNKKDKQPDFRLFSLDGGVGVPSKFTPRAPRATEEGSPIPPQPQDKYKVNEPEWPDNDANEEAGPDDQRLEDGGNEDDKEEDDGLPY